MKAGRAGFAWSTSQRQDISLRDLTLGLSDLREIVYRLPPFALPHKDVVTEVVRDRSRGFLESNQSYRATVQAKGRARTATRFLIMTFARIGLTNLCGGRDVVNLIRWV